MIVFYVCCVFIVFVLIDDCGLFVPVVFLFRFYCLLWVFVGIVWI